MLEKINYKRLIALLIETLLLGWVFYQLVDVVTINKHDNLDVNIRLLFSMLLFIRYFILINTLDNKIKPTLRYACNVIFFVGMVLVVFPTPVIFNLVGVGCLGAVTLLPYFLKYKGVISIIDRLKMFQNPKRAFTVSILYYTGFLICMIISIIAREYSIPYLIFLIILVGGVGYLTYLYVIKRNVSGKRLYYLYIVGGATILFLIIQKFANFDIYVCACVIIALSALPILKFSSPYFVDANEYNPDKLETIKVI